MAAARVQQQLGAAQGGLLLNLDHRQGGEPMEDSQGWSTSCHLPDRTNRRKMSRGRPGLHRFRQRWNFEGFGGDRLALRALQAHSEALKANSDPLEVDGAALQAQELVVRLGTHPPAGRRHRRLYRGLGSRCLSLSLFSVIMLLYEIAG